MKPDERPCSTLERIMSVQPGVTVIARPVNAWITLTKRAAQLELYISRDDCERNVVVDVEDAAGPPRYARIVAIKNEGVDHEALLCAMVRAAVEEMGRQGR